MNNEISSVEFLSLTSAKRNINKVKKNDLFSAPSLSSEQSKKVSKIDLDYRALKKMSEEERNQTIQDAINKALGDAVGTLSSNNYTVTIDPGHGGYDPGAVVNGVNEKDLNLNIALAIRDYLEGIPPEYPQFNVVMTRSGDYFVSLTERHNIANNANSDIFVSIHNNTSSNTSTRGTTARYPNNHDVTLSINLANFLINAITPNPLPKHSDAAYQDLQVLRNTTMPAALLEAGFMTNSNDLQILQTQYDDIGYYLGLAINVWCQVNI
jgi:N-acetylmuramoyl-L-alanine amidase